MAKQQAFSMFLIYLILVFGLALFNTFFCTTKVLLEPGWEICLPSWLH